MRYSKSKKQAKAAKQIHSNLTFFGLKADKLVKSLDSGPAST